MNDTGSSDDDETAPLPPMPPGRPLTPGVNCWRIERATRASLVVDADDYFAVVRQAMLLAQKRIMLVGWDFDARVRLGAKDDASGAPATIGRFVLWLMHQRPELQLYLLRWDFGAIKALFRGTTPITVTRWAIHPRIHVKLDSAHPFGASHHQKMVVIDDCLALCGGIDITSERWDTREHLDDEPRRVGPHRVSYGPWHDASIAVSGPVARALDELARDRWRVAGGGELPPIGREGPLWPDALETHFEDIDVAIARTQPTHGDIQEAHEIEALYLDLIARARRHVYVEGQYFASGLVAEAIARRLSEPDGPEFVLVTPQQAHGWLEQVAMDTARARLMAALRHYDVHKRLRMYMPFTAGGRPIYVHAKIMVVDDQVLRIGSSNLNNRSLRLDTECDVAIDAALNPGIEARILARRDDLIAEHLGVTAAEVAAAIEATGSLIGGIERLRAGGRSLHPYEEPPLSGVGRFLAENELLDPEGPGRTFEPLTKRNLFKRLKPPPPKA